MKEKFLALRGLSLPLLILIVGLGALVFSVFSKWNKTANDRELRGYEHLQSKGRQSALVLSEFLSELQRSLDLSEDPVAALARLNLQAVAANRSSPLEMLPGEVEVLKVGKLARFEGRLSSGQFVKSISLGLRVFPSEGDPAVVLLGSQNSAFLVGFSFNYRFVIVALSPSVLRKHLEDSSLDWALVSNPSAWAVKKEEPADLEYIDRAGLDTLNSESEKKIVARLAAVPDQVQTVSNNSGYFSGQRMMGSSRVGGSNLHFILSQKIAVSPLEIGMLILQEGVVLLSALGVFVVLFVLQRRNLGLLLQKSKKWIESLPLFTPVDADFLSPSQPAAVLLADQMKHAEFLVQSWRRDVSFLRSIVSDVVTNCRKNFLLEETKEHDGLFEGISWEKSPGTGFDIFVSKLQGPQGILVLCFSLREPDDIVGLATTHLRLKKIKAALDNGGQSSADQPLVETTDFDWLEKTVAENGLEKMLPSELSRTCLLFVLIQNRQVAVRQVVPAGGFEFKSLLNVHTLNLNDVRLLTFRTPAVSQNDAEQGGLNAAEPGRAV